MNKTFKAAIAAVVALSATQAARADLTLNGAVGLPLNPTAQIPNEGGVRLQGNFYDGDGGLKHYGLFAAGRVGENIEISGGINKLDAPAGSLLDKTGFAIGAKYLITRESDPAGVRFAVGAGYDHALIKNVHVYGVATKSFGNPTNRAPITGHLGLRYDRFDFPVAGDTDKVSVFAGAEVPLSSTGDFSLVGEIQSKNIDGGDAPYSISGRYRPQGKPFGISAGYQRQGIISDGNFFVQIGWTFDTGS
jgi:hypothetical protein